ncbi:hypothetical protein AGMMS50249_7210 [candidate division SR1 bacterium]|nr:hypothetical protein AGMMS50249_7210 [candidate division SR1 bacterium]
MKDLYLRIMEGKGDIVDIQEIEKSDPQFQSIVKLEKTVENKELFLSLIIANSIICYQIYMTGEQYRETFCNYFDKASFQTGEIITKVEKFANIYNKRILEGKIKRLKKLTSFFQDFNGRSAFYHENMVALRDDLARYLGVGKGKIQRNDGMKTINFAIKMFSYGARNIYGFRRFPVEIGIPIDSRLEKIFEKYRGDYNDINLFYTDLAGKLCLSPLHLDAVLWINTDKLMRGNS